MRLRPFSSSMLAVAVAGGLLGTMFGLGAAGQEPVIFDGSSWLWSRSVGEVARVNGNSGTVDLEYGVEASRGNQVAVAQNTDFLLLHDPVTGRVSSVDLTRMGFAGALQVAPGGDVVVLLSGDDAVVVDRARGLVRPVDPATLQPRGEPLQFAGPLVGGGFDESGGLWLSVPSQGTVVEVRVDGDAVTVNQTVPVAEPGSELAITVLDQGALAIDLGGDAVVAVVDGQVHRLTAPVPLAGARVPARTVGDLVAVTVPEQAAIVVVRQLAAGGEVGQIPLPDGGGQALPFAGQVYVPDDAAGRVRVFTPDGGEQDPVELPGVRGPLELEVRQDLLFVNAVDAPSAAIVDADGEVSLVDKFDPAQAQPDPEQDESRGPSQESSEPVPKQAPPGPPGPPAPVTALAADGQVELSWGEAATTGGAAVDRHLITWDGGQTEVEGGTLSTVVTGLENGQTYEFRVVAENELGQSPPALSEPVTPVAAAPDPPEAPTAEVRRQRVVVSWAPVAGAAEYVVTPLRGGEAGANPPQTVSGESTEFEGLTLGAPYRFTVVARSADGGASDPSPPSNEVVLAEDDPLPVGDSLNLTEWKPTDRAVFVSLEAPEGTTDCTITVGPTTEGCGDGDRVRLAGLDPDTTYTVHVTATRPASDGSPEDAEDEEEITTYPRGIGGVVICEGCDDGAPIHDDDDDEPEPIGHHEDGDQILAVCRIDDDAPNVDASEFGGKDSSKWLFKADGRYMPWAYVELNNGDDIDALPNCSHQ